MVYDVKSMVGPGGGECALGRRKQVTKDFLQLLRICTLFNGKSYNVTTGLLDVAVKQTWMSKDEAIQVCFLYGTYQYARYATYE